MCDTHVALLSTELLSQILKYLGLPSAPPPGTLHDAQYTLNNYISEVVLYFIANLLLFLFKRQLATSSSLSSVKSTTSIRTL